MPTLRAFRGLRFDVGAIDLSSVLAPPYDIIGPTLRQELLARDEHNIVRVELPADLGDAADEDYAEAARTLAAWRRDGILVRDAQPTVTVHRMRWTRHDGSIATATGVLAQLRLAHFGPEGGVLPHERTMGGPKQDRLRLLQVTRTNTSPVVLLSSAPAGPAAEALARLTERVPDVTARTQEDGVDHELWVCPGDEASGALAVLASAPLTIADGHHRYETALAYRDARRAQVAAADDGAADRTADRTAHQPAWEHVLAVVYPIGQAPSVLPTHRVARGRPCGDDLLARLDAYARIEPLDDREALLSRMGQPGARSQASSGSAGRIGLLTRDRPALLWVDQAAVAALLPAGLSEASRRLDVNALSALIEHAYGEDPGVMAGDGRLWYVKDARQATQQVVDEAASAAWLLEGVLPEAIAAVATAGEVMPPKSTYFDPKAPTGLVLNPLE